MDNDVAADHHHLVVPARPLDPLVDQDLVDGDLLVVPVVREEHPLDPLVDQDEDEGDPLVVPVVGEAHLLVDQVVDGANPLEAPVVHDAQDHGRHPEKKGAAMVDAAANANAVARLSVARKLVQVSRAIIFKSYQPHPVFFFKLNILHRYIMSPGN